MVVGELHTTRLIFESIEDLRHVIQGADLRGVQLSADGAPCGGALFASARDFLFTTGQFDADLRSRGMMHPDLMTFGVSLAEHVDIVQWFVEALPGDVFTFAPGDEQDGRQTGRMHYATVSLSVEEVARIAGSDLPVGDRAFWEKRRHFRASPHVRATLCRTIVELAAHLMRTDATMSGQRLALFQHDVVEAFLSGIFLDEAQPAPRPVHPVAKVVRQVEDLMDGQEPGSVHVSDLCSALELPRRTVERAFHETLGMGPAHYLMLRRMSAVRSLLRNGDPSTTTVSDIAMDHGFWELGRFAATYRRMFGEKPSETLRR
jgi:AraC family ethanolamine operon transcriptional activator